MTDQNKIEFLLAESFKDEKFSKDEKHSLHTLLSSLQKQDEMLSFARNKAFDLFRAHYHEHPESFVYGTNWLERVVKSIDSVRCELVPHKSTAYFSPGKSCLSQIVNSIAAARKSIDVCVFTISDDRISEALLEAHKAKIDVRIVSDNDKSNDRGSDIHYLAKHCVPVKLDRSSYHMHHKFALFDQRFLINGSFNWTRSATTSNEENITVLHDKHLIDAFSNTFNELWSECKSI
ncbi:MAG: cardiolipin hydrolase [Alteromonadaceae bacterium]|jgi:phosphatidylserine/phosphatidylglycerophosphate/cardiolipin synthase-like enzyme